MSNIIVEIQKEVTQSVIEALKKGGIDQWVKPWIDSGEPPVPFNFDTKNHYNGINILLLWMAAEKKGFSRNAWLTFNQAKSMGGRIKKNEKSVRCLHYRVVEKKSDIPGEECTSYPILKYFNLFNVDQIEGLGIHSIDSKFAFNNDDVISDIVSVATDYSEATGLAFSKRGDIACYYPGYDRLNMPIGDFRSPEDYASTLAHELIHSTGHKKRLDRFSKIKKMFPDNDKKFTAMEELVAEMGSKFLCSMFGFNGSHLQHESYLSSWLEHLENDYTFIFRAASASSKAMDYILSEANFSFEEDDEEAA